MNFNIDFIKEKIFGLTGFEFDGQIIVEDYNGIKVDFNNGNAIIGCKDPVGLSRGLFLFAYEYTNGRNFPITEKAEFEIFGAMLDVSRNGVLKVETVKKIIDSMAALGYTHISLYLEDVFEMEKYPRFGYMRGRYSKEELKEIKDYASGFGMEILPSIETLGHMEQYLRWPEANAIKDTSGVLLVDCKETYEFLEEEIKTMREVSGCEYINVNMDEAFGLGSGKYADINGLEDKFSIMKKHAKKVYEICEKYNFKPIIASDMFFVMNSEIGEYYDENVKISENLLAEFPKEYSVLYWDYENTKKETYSHFIKEHKNFKRNLFMLGGIRTWESFFEDSEYTFEASVPFLEAAIENGEKNFICSMWGDDGSETNIYHSIGSLPIFSEYCYRGVKCNKNHIFKISEYLTKMPYENRLLISKIHGGMHNYCKISKQIFYSDLFYNLVNLNYDSEKMMANFKEIVLSTKKLMEKKDKNFEYYSLCNAFSDVIYKKINLLSKIKQRYIKKDMDYLKNAVNIYMPELAESYMKFYKLFRQDWLKYKKPNGLEVMDFRIGGIILRLDSLKERLQSYLNGEVKTIEELDEERITADIPTGEVASRVITPSLWF